MKNKLLLLILWLPVLVACETQSRPTADLSAMVNATLTALTPGGPQIDPLQPTLTPTTLPEMKPRLSLDILRNCSYASPDWGEFQLSDGLYYRTPPTSQESPENYTTRLLDLSVFGDLNADGMEDAIVFLVTQNGGTGRFVEMAAVLNLDGIARPVATVYLGDRIMVESGIIQAGQITLNLVVQGPNDGLCCPSQHDTRNYRFDGSQLTQAP